MCVRLSGRSLYTSDVVYMSLKGANKLWHIVYLLTGKEEAYWYAANVGDIIDQCAKPWLTCCIDYTRGLFLCHLPLQHGYCFYAQLQQCNQKSGVSLLYL